MNEMFRICLDDAEVLHLLFRAGEDFARASVPEAIIEAFMAATMTALQKPDGGVCGMSPARLSGGWLPEPSLGSSAKPLKPSIPIRFVTRAGADCVGHVIRILTDGNRAATVLSIDGIGAYDHVHRSARWRNCWRCQVSEDWCLLSVPPTVD